MSKMQTAWAVYVDQTERWISAELRDGPVELTGSTLPARHDLRERFADLLGKTYMVKVNRFGTGNAEHSGVLDGCGVSSIEVIRRL